MSSNEPGTSTPSNAGKKGQMGKRRSFACASKPKKRKIKSKSVESLPLERSSDEHVEIAVRQCDKCAELDSLRHENARLGDQLKYCEAKCAELSSQNTRLGDQLKNCEAKGAELSSQNTRLGDQLRDCEAKGAELSSQNTRLGDQLKDCEAKGAELSSLRRENTRLAMQLKHCKKCTELDSLRCEYTRLTMQIKNCNDSVELESLRLDNARLAKQLKKEIHISCAWQPASQATDVTINERCEKLHKVIERLAGGQGADDKTAEAVVLISKYLKRNTAITTGLHESNVKGFEHRLSATEDFTLWANAHLTGSQRRIIVSELNRLGMNPFAPAHRFDAERKKAQMQTELKFSRIELTEGSNCPFVEVASVKAALTQKIRELKLKGRLLETPEFAGKIWVCIGGDKGGSTTKLAASIVNARNPNSVKNLVLIGMYEGTDNPANLRTAFSTIGAELSEIKSLPVPETDDPDNAVVKDVPVELFLTGDTMFISHIEGHKGATAVFPCPFCLIPKSALKQAGQWDYMKSYTDRTYDSYQSAAQLRPSGNPTSRSRQTTSVSQPPTFPIPVANISPPQLHIALGIGTALYKSLQQCCWQRDLVTAGLSPNADAKVELAQMKKRLKESEVPLNAKKQMANQNRSLLNSFLAAQKTLPKSGKPCNAIVCLNDVSRNVSERSGDWVACQTCSRRLHFACEGIGILREIQDSSTGNYSCLQCRGANDISVLIDDCKSKVSVTDRMFLTQSANHIELKEKIVSLEKIVVENNGPCTKKLTETLKQMSIDLRAYHSGTFVGNHIRKMLSGEGPTQLAAALGDDAQTQHDRSKYEKLLTGLGRIQDFYAARFLTDDEIGELEKRCQQFAADFKSLLPGESVTPKLHFLVSHLPQFAKRHKTLGLLSEQSLESLHARINGIERQFAGIRDVERRMKMVVQHHYATSSV